MAKSELTSYIQGILKGAKLKNTQPRFLILKTLLSNHGPFTIEEIHTLAGPKECDRVTVYRTLAILEEAGLVVRCHFGEDSVRYEYNDTSHHHHHIICKKCKKMEDLKLCPFEFLDKEVIKLGYSEVSHLVSFLGVCNDCK